MATVYLTAAEFDARIEEAEREELTNGDTAEFDRAENDAAGTIDGYISVRYTLPLLSTPAIVKKWATAIARFLLWDKRAPEEVRLRYEDAIKELQACAAGELNLPPEVLNVAAPTSISVAGYSATRVFTEDTLRDY